MADGKRQIFSFQIAGDIPDLQGLFLNEMDHSLTALDAVTVAFIPHAAINALINDHPDAGRLLWRESLLDASIFREWIANTGRRQALCRTAHLLCELMCRAEAMGLASGKSYKLAITQTHYADALGLSLVHVKRTMKELRAEGLLGEVRGVIDILDWDALKEVGDFDESYLDRTLPNVNEGRLQLS